MIIQLIVLQRSSARTRTLNVASSGDVADVVALVREVWAPQAQNPDCMWVSQEDPAPYSSSAVVPVEFRGLSARGQPVAQQCFADWLRDENLRVPVYPIPLYVLLCPAGCSPHDSVEIACDDDRSDAPSRENWHSQSRDSSCERSRESSSERPRDACTFVSRAHLPHREPPLRYDATEAGSGDGSPEGPPEPSKRARSMPATEYFSEDEEDGTPRAGDASRAGGFSHTVAYAVGAERPMAHMSARTVGNMAQQTVSDRDRHSPIPRQLRDAQRTPSPDNAGGGAPQALRTLSPGDTDDGSPRHLQRTPLPDNAGGGAPRHLQRTPPPDNAGGGRPRAQRDSQRTAPYADSDSQRTAPYADSDSQRTATYADSDSQRTATYADSDSQRTATYADSDGSAMHSICYVDDDSDGDLQTAHMTP